MGVLFQFFGFSVFRLFGFHAQVLVLVPSLTKNI